MVFSVLGEIRLFAGNYEPVGWAFCDGRLLSINANTDLFELLGFTYGTNQAGTMFGIPNLAPLAAGNGQLVRYIICTQGEWPQSLDGFVGAIKLFAGLFPPNGWLPCDGRLVTVSQNDTNLVRLASVLGQTYGGDGQTTTGLPLLAPIPAAVTVNGLALPQYILCARGPIANRPGNNRPAGLVEEYIGEVGLFAGSYVPQNLAEANGQSLNVSDAPALYSVLGYTGGNATFPLPNLGGLAPLPLPYLVAVQGVFPPRP